jgi:hypothetical protein
MLVDGIAGISMTGEIDPLNPCDFQSLPAFHAALWKDGEVTDFGTLGEGRESDRVYLNDAAKLSALPRSMRYLPLLFWVQQHVHSSGRMD